MDRSHNHIQMADVSLDTLLSIIQITLAMQTHLNMFSVNAQTGLDHIAVKDGLLREVFKTKFQLKYLFGEQNVDSFGQIQDKLKQAENSLRCDL